MLRSDSQVTLGVILCKYCHCTIDTIDTEKVIIYYIECEQETCIAKRKKNGEKINEY
jgi:hypothetical protein